MIRGTQRCQKRKVQVLSFLFFFFFKNLLSGLQLPCSGVATKRQGREVQLLIIVIVVFASVN
jgi:hypothetical protein